MAGNITPSWIQVNPSLVLPELLLQYQQASGAFGMLPDGTPMVRLSEGDLQVYIKKVDVRTKVAAGTNAYNVLPGVAITAQQINTPTYLIRTQADYDHHDLAAAGNWGISLPEAQRLGMRQGIFQQMRNALLYGFSPANGEGILNATGATAVNLPADSNGNTTIVTYDNGQLGQFLLGQIGALKTRMMQVGMPGKITITTPQRIQVALTYTGIVQLTQFQREGAGTATIAEMVEKVASLHGDDVEWLLDDTLIGQGAGGTDAIIISAPTIKKPVGTPNTNEFAKLAPGLDATILMLSDMAAPKEIVSPLPQGGTNIISELRITSGWVLRPEAVTIVSASYQ
jgi:hypothetical protein